MTSRSDRCFACILEAQPPPPKDANCADWVIAAVAAIVACEKYGAAFIGKTIEACPNRTKHAGLILTLRESMARVDAYNPTLQ